MGRQAHIIRQLLGRSPFGEPLRDEDGNFILGPHAHDNDAPGYRQQFDERGHPRNRQSRSSAAALRRAQNDVLATVGVVVRKGEERKSKWERLDEKEKRRLVNEENQQGKELAFEDRFLGFSLPWSLTMLRMRLVTFESYSTLPLHELLTREYGVLEPLHLLLAGYIPRVAASIPRLCRYFLVGMNDGDEINFVNAWRRGREPQDWISGSVEVFCARLFLQAIELPLLVHSTLDVLSIVPKFSWPSWRSFIPFSGSSVIALPLIPSTFDAYTLRALILSLSKGPLFLYLIRDYLHQELHFRIYALLRQLLTKPDRPDVVSLRAYEETDSIWISGIGYPWSGDPVHFERDKRSFGPKSALGALRVAFPWVYKVLDILSRGRFGKSRGRLTPVLQRQFRSLIRERYWQERAKLEDVPIRGSPSDIALRLTVANRAFDSANLDPAEELVDAEAWINDALDSETGRPHPVDRSERALTRSQEQRQTHQQQTDAANNVIAQAFQATPTSDAVVIHANDGQIVMATQRTPNDPLNVSEMNNIHTIHASEVPLDVLIRALDTIETEPGQTPPQRQQRRDESQAVQEAPTAAAAAESPPTPVPGISRALSLTDTLIQNHLRLTNTPRPVRRPTETDDSLAAISETLRAEAERLPSPRPSNEPGEHPPSQQPQTLHQTIEDEPSVMLNPDPPLMPFRHRQYRVTMLSNFPADSLAWHTSALLTSFILWPIDAMWLRSVAQWALSNPNMARSIDPERVASLGRGILGRPLSVLGLGTWFGGAPDTLGKTQYVSRILLTLGLEGLVRGACWGLGVWLVRRWKGVYGWSQF